MESAARIPFNDFFRHFSAEDSRVAVLADAAVVVAVAADAPAVALNVRVVYSVNRVKSLPRK